MVPLFDHLAAAFGRSVPDAEDALTTLVADIHARCRTYGEAAYPGLGTFRLGPDGMGFEPDPALAIVVNHRFAGLGAVPAVDAAPDTAWSPAPPQPPVFVPLADAENDQVPRWAPDSAALEPTPPPLLPAFDAPEFSPHAPVRDVAPAAPRFETTPPVVVSDVPEAPKPTFRAVPPEPAARRGRMLPFALLLLFGLLLAALAYWASKQWPGTPPDPAPVAAAPSPPDTSTARSDTTRPGPAGAAQDSTPASAATSAPEPAPARAANLSTDRPEAPARRDASPPATRPAPRAAPAPAREATPQPPARRPTAPVSEAPAPASSVPTPSSAEEAVERRALRGQEPVEPGSGGWTLIVGSAPNAEEGEAAARRYRLQGYRTAVLPGTKADGTAIYRVGLGRFTTLPAAQAAVARLRGDAFPGDAWLLKLR